MSMRLFYVASQLISDHSKPLSTFQGVPFQKCGTPNGVIIKFLLINMLRWKLDDFISFFAVCLGGLHIST